jgi:hypothetical protein
MRASANIPLNIDTDVVKIAALARDRFAALRVGASMSNLKEVMP